MRPSEALQGYARPSLSDDELAWIGAIVSYWSVADHQLDILISTLKNATGASGTGRRDVHNPTAKAAYVGELVEKVDGFDLHSELTTALSDRFTVLAAQRNKFAHWLAIRGSDGGIDLVDPRELNLVDERYDLKPRPSFSEAAMIDLCKSMLDWIQDATTLIRHFFIDGPITSKMTWNGPKPETRLDWRMFRSIRPSQPAAG